MSDDPISPVEVRRQIWESLVSMLRVYAHAASINSSEYGVASTGDNVWVTLGECALEVGYSPKTGDAHWRLEKAGHNQEGTFQIDDHGRMLFPDGPRELDHAAIHWVQQLGTPACAV